ncbi:hypothetical protein M3J57_28690, partial [Klebsiella pneumoniae]|nr:hypothetical protein [Klebsiella pneumoniae]
DYERTLKKASSGKSKPVPQLGEQPNQEIEPLVTGKEMTREEFITDTGLMSRPGKLPFPERQCINPRPRKSRGTPHKHDIKDTSLLYR